MSFFEAPLTFSNTTLPTGIQEAVEAQVKAQIQHRRDLVLLVKDCGRALMPFAHAEGSQLLDENIASARDLCEAVERCLLHGMHLRAFHGAVPLWGLLERMEGRSSSKALRDSVQAVVFVSDLRTPLAKARGWVRHVLNQGLLDDCLAALAQAEPKLLEAFYEADAILRSQQDLAMLLAVSRSLRVLPFRLNVGDPALHRVPGWLELQMAAPSLVAPCREATDRTGAEAKGKLLRKAAGGSLFSSLEAGLGRMLESFDSATALASRLMDPQAPPFDINGRRSFFGSSLEDLVLDEGRCVHAKLDPALGLPTQAHRMLSLLHERAATPGLFRVQPSPSAVLALRLIVEAEQQIPDGADAHAVATLLLQWLEQLPEPLLGTEHFSALQACQDLESDVDRVRNCSLLVQEAPWYCLPLLVRVIGLLTTCLSPANTATNGLNIVGLSVTFAPSLLRPPGCFLTRNGSTPEEIDRAHIAATAAGSHVISFLLSRQGAVFEPLRQTLQHRQVVLASKCSRIRELQITTMRGLRDMPAADFAQFARDLWMSLGPAQAKRLITPKINSDETVEDGSATATVSAPASLEDLLADVRWDHCGFPSGQPLRDFDVGGWTAATCLLGFLQKYPKSASSLVADFAQVRARLGCSLPTTCCRIAEVTIELLGLTPSMPMQQLAKLSTWQLLGAEQSVQELFSLIMLSFDEAWHSLTTRVERLPHRDTASQAIAAARDLAQRVLECSPRSIEHMWDLYRQMKIEPKLQQKPGAPVPHDSANYGCGAIDDGGSYKNDDKGGCEGTAQRCLEPVAIATGNTEVAPCVVLKAVSGVQSCVIGASELLSDQHLVQLEASLPQTHQGYDWVRVFSLLRDGANLGTLLHNCAGAVNLLMVVRDEGGALFGALATSPLRPEDKYYGSSTCCVWAFSDGLLTWYPSSGKNSYYIHCTREALGFGGGGNFAFFVDSALKYGCSGPCQTFDSPCLASQSEFICVALEVFVFRPSMGPGAANISV